MGKQVDGDDSSSRAVLGNNLAPVQVEASLFVLMLAFVCVCVCLDAG